MNDHCARHLNGQWADTAWHAVLADEVTMPY